MPKPGKKSAKVTLGVIEPKLGAAITEALGFSCNHIGVVPEIIRGIRVHFASLVKGSKNHYHHVKSTAIIIMLTSQALLHKPLRLRSSVWVTAIPEPK